MCHIISQKMEFFNVGSRKIEQYLSVVEVVEKNNINAVMAFVYYSFPDIPWNKNTQSAFLIRERLTTGTFLKEVNVLPGREQGKDVKMFRANLSEGYFKQIVVEGYYISSTYAE